MASSLTPYYDDGSVTLYHGDCRDVLPALGMVDVCITDPPYEAEAHTLGRRQSVAGVVQVRPLDFTPIDAALRRAVGDALARMTRGWILVFCQTDDRRYHECQRKFAYGRLCARRVAAIVRRRTGERIHSYHCPWCDAWHIGHISKAYAQ